MRKIALLISGGAGNRTACEILEETILSDEGGAESGAQTLAKPDISPELAELIEAWPSLPEPIKAAIRALVGSVVG